MPQPYEISVPTGHKSFTPDDSATFSPPLRRIIPQAAGVLMIVDNASVAVPYVVTAGQPIDIICTQVKATGSSGAALLAAHVGHL